MHIEVLDDETLKEKFKNVPVELIEYYKNHMKEYIKIIVPINEYVGAMTEEVNKATPAQLFAINLTCRVLIKKLWLPYEIASNHYDWTFYLQEYQQFNLEADNSVRSIYSLLDDVNRYKVESRGIIDSKMNPNVQNRILKNTIDSILGQLDEFKYKDPEYVRKLEATLSDIPISVLKRLMVDSKLNYLNKNKTVYVLFEKMVLAPLKLRKIISEGKMTLKDIESAIYTIKGHLKKYPHIEAITLDSLLDETKCLKSLLKVKKNQTFGYIGTLVEEYYGIDYVVLRKFYIEFFAEASDTKKTNFMKNKYEYIKVTPIKNHHSFEIDFPCPFSMFVLE